MVRILLGLTGSVACIKADELVKQLQQLGEVNVVLTQPALHFIDKDGLGCPVYSDGHRFRILCSRPLNFIFLEDEWNTYKKRDDPVLHIEVCN
jgi:phosphopantothenoylcysteine synthetase/decarboxylase